MKNNKKILSLLLVALFSVIVIFLIVWAKSKKPAPASAPGIEQNNADKKNPEIFFASNGKNTVYKIKKGDQWSVIWNGQEGKLYDFVSNPVFSFDGSQIAYNAEIDGQAYVVINNTQEINAYQKANYITFSKNGKTIAFVATKGSNAYVVISAQLSDQTGLFGTINESQTYKEIGIAKDPNGNSSAIIISADGTKIAYVIKENGKTYIVINGQKSQGYDNISSFSFSDDGKSYTYQAQNGNSVLIITNNKVVSSTNSPPPSNQSSSASQVNNYHPRASSVYRYKISTEKDVVLDQDRLDYSDCPKGSQCNF